MFKICLFDLDETLVRTDDLEELRPAGKNNETATYTDQVLGRLKGRENRHIYSLTLLQEIRTKFSNMKLGVFTRSPRSYAMAVLNWAFPGFYWDIIVAYEDVKPTKPYGKGIDLAMDKFGLLHVDHLPYTILVGDGDVDVRAAYNCGCVVALDQSAWPKQRGKDHWPALEHVPDAIISRPGDLLAVLSNPGSFLPELERALLGAPANVNGPRFDRIGHFVPRSVGGDTTSHPIYVCGRSFANYDDIKYRKTWHTLTSSIEENKEADVFPIEWIQTVKSFIQANYIAFWETSKIVVSVVPHRPGRKARLENFLAQLAMSLETNPIPHRTVVCAPELLAYKAGVKSQHNDLLGRDARFANVRDHLFVQQLGLIERGTAFLIIDDVVTTGASLIYANKYLKAAGAVDVKCLAMAKNVGKLYS